MNILVFGGSGYIGQSTIGKLIELGHSVTNIDLVPAKFNFSKKYTYIELDLRDRIYLPVEYNKFDSCINFAAYKDLEESVKNPFKYYDNNLRVMINTLDLAHRLEIKQYIYSSSAAVYAPTEIAKEDSPKSRDNAYGNSKLIGEEILEEIHNKYNLQAICLRYFNPIGLTKYSKDTSDSLFGNIYNCIKSNSELKIYGSDYESRDGTCIRDFIDINDLVDAHIFILNNYFKLNRFDIFNVGTGTGQSINEIANTVKSILPTFNFVYAPRRLGDEVGGYADTSKINSYGWYSKVPLHESINNILKDVGVIS